MKSSFYKLGVGFLILLSYSLHAETPKPPNVILILADDLGYGDLGCYGQKLIQTPHLDQLAKSGIRFTQAYAGSPVCAASRAVLMTGYHTGHAPVRDNIPHYESYLEEEDFTLAELFQQAGYQCGGVGKWSLGDPGTVGRPANQGFSSWLGYLNQDHAHYYFPEYLDDNEGRLSLTGNTETRHAYSHHLMADRALEFVRQHHDRPFFFYTAFTLPHFSAPEEDPARLAIPSTEPYSENNWTPAEKKYAAMVTLLDQDVGRLMTLCDNLGIRDNTLFIFTSDNGPWGAAPKKFQSAGPLRGAKRDLYEGGIRVPFIASWPGVIPAGKVSDEVFAFWDVMPTLTELLGRKNTEDLDGISMLNVLKGEKPQTQREYLYWDYGHCRPRYQQAVRLRNWKGIRIGQENKIQLYNLKTDLAEEHDVSADHPKVVKEIAEIMKTAATPSDRYPIGEIYRGKPIWSPSQNTP
ncbi:N-acetylgalactosamine 6-sulfate sulfatase [Planctomycetales bacterium 10988]|nr:N-acetylgalactosamine 6-sulfate sulfatase [Planctomycetales bacterium 10988]